MCRDKVKAVLFSVDNATGLFLEATIPPVGNEKEQKRLALKRTYLKLLRT